MSDQRKLISQEIPDHLDLPELDDLFKIIKINAFTTEKTIFFQVIMPLFNSQKFHVFKIISVPMKLADDNLGKITTHGEFLIASILAVRHRIYIINQINSMNKI